MTIHVLTRLGTLRCIVVRRAPGSGLWVALVAVTLVAGAVLALGTLPAADHLQDRATALIAVDSR